MARIIDVIEAPNQGPNEMVARIPEVGSGDFRMGSQVIVRESQRSVFYRDGKSLDELDPGRHTITTANLPILSGLLRLGTGGADIFTAEVDTIYIDEEKAYERAREFLQLVMPRYVNRLKMYEGKEPLFHKHNLDQEIAKIHRRQVPLKDGGSIVIDQTEALVAIDVNSGSFRVDNSAEETAYQVNLLAAREIARQIRLRDLGGVVVNDFIDMHKEKHRRGVERALRDAVKRDRARTKILRTSPFGLIEMTRQRVRPSLKRSVYRDCPSCNATGLVKSSESMAIEVVRLLILASQHPETVEIAITVAGRVAAYLNNKKRRELIRLEEEGGIKVQVLALDGVSPEHLVFDCRDAEGREVKFSTK